MKLPQLIPVLGAFALLFALHAGAQGALVRPQPAPPGTSASGQPTPEQTAKVLVQALHIENFKLLSSGTGWASTGSKLLRTTDNGAHWKDISPPIALRQKGDDFLKGLKHLLMKVPSSIVPMEHNYLLNPLHPGMKEVKMLNKEPFDFDQRLV